MSTTATTTATAQSPPAAGLIDSACFVAPEGVYSLTDEHKQPPSALTQPSLIGAAQYPTRLATVSIRYPAAPAASSRAPAPGFAQLLGAGSKKDKEKEKEKEKERLTVVTQTDGHSVSSSDDALDTAVDPNAAAASNLDPPTALFTDPALLTPATPSSASAAAGTPGSSGKRKSMIRPKQNIRTTSSTFITRVQNSEGFPKTLHARYAAGGEATFMFYNYGKTFMWVDVDAKNKEPLAKVTFSAFPTCHDVNRLTACPERIDLILGFSTGDLIWLDAMSSRYTRLNKQGAICASACTSVRWVPGSPTLFLASFANGAIVVFDREREDPTPGTQGTGSSNSWHDDIPEDEWNPIQDIYVTLPPWHPTSALSSPPTGQGSASANADSKATKHLLNPISHWRVSRRRIVDFAFSPDVKYVAAISEDGCLRVIDAVAEQLLACFSSYFGALTCLAWSPDGRLLLTGGQDDLLTIFAPWESRVVARCQGHSSFVVGVAFDEWRERGRGGYYRFGSVGEDCKLILWDFSSGALHRPKFHPTHQQRLSMSSTISLALRPVLSGSGRGSERGHHPTQHPQEANELGMMGGETDSPSEENPTPRFHPAPPRNEVAVVQPVLVKSIEPDLLTDIAFIPRGVLTSTKIGTIKLWVRPLPSSAGRKGEEKTRAERGR